jgi:AcrR family transcriptional regulator
MGPLNFQVSDLGPFSAEIMQYFGGWKLPKRFDDDRRLELLDGVVEIIIERGFSEVTVSDMANELHCSVSSLYRIATNKDGLIILAISRWGDLTLEKMEAHSLQGMTAIDKARLYWHAAVEIIRQLSHEFRNDVDRFESARLAYATISNRFIERFVELLDEAVESDEIEPINSCFVVHIFRQIAFVIRDEQILEKCGLDASQALEQMDRIIWNGIKNGKGGNTNGKGSKKRG